METLKIEELSCGSPPAAETPTAAALLNSVMEGAEVGLAVFDSSFSLIQCNSCYANLFDYQPSDLQPGTPLQDLIRLTHERVDKNAEKVERRIGLVLRRLQADAKSVHRPRRTGSLQADRVEDDASHQAESVGMQTR